MIWELLGGLCLFIYGFELLKFLWKLIRLYVLPRFGFKVDLKKFGSWAVVTGSTDGIGKAIAKQLAARGLNLVLISRSQEKLDVVAKEMAECHGVEVKTIQFDFNTTSGYEKIKEQLKDVDVGILVNNVGVNIGTIVSHYLDVHNETVGRLVNVNVRSVCQMTQMMLPKMLEKKKGLIVHMSSIAGFVPFPFMSLYGPSKSFVRYFSNALNAECKQQGVISQVVCPGVVYTNMSGNAVKRSATVGADNYAESAVNSMGLYDTWTGYIRHEIVQFFITVIYPRIYFCYKYKDLSKRLIKAGKGN